MKFSDIPQRIAGGTYQCNMPLEDLDAWLTRREQDPYYQLQLNPDFQRGHVWTKAQQSAYLEYFLTGGKSGLTIYFNKPSWQSAGEEPLSLPKTQTPFRPCGWKGVFVRFSTRFTSF